MVDVQPFVSVLGQLQDLTSPKGLQRNEPGSKIRKGFAAANGILMVHVRSLPQIASITIFQDYCGTLK